MPSSVCFEVQILQMQLGRASLACADMQLLKMPLTRSPSPVCAIRALNFFGPFGHANIFRSVLKSKYSRCNSDAQLLRSLLTSICSNMRLMRSPSSVCSDIHMLKTQVMSSPSSVRPDIQKLKMQFMGTPCARGLP